MEKKFYRHLTTILPTVSTKSSAVPTKLLSDSDRLYRSFDSLDRQDFIFTGHKGVAFLVIDVARQNVSFVQCVQDTEAFGATFQHSHLLFVTRTVEDFDVFFKLQ